MVRYFVKFLANHLFDRGLWKHGIMIMLVGGILNGYFEYANLIKNMKFGSAATSILLECDISESQCHNSLKKFIKDTKDQYLPINPMRCLAGIVVAVGLLDSISTGVLNDVQSFDFSEAQAREVDMRQKRRELLAKKINAIPWYGYCLL